MNMILQYCVFSDIQYVAKRYWHYPKKEKIVSYINVYIQVSFNNAFEFLFFNSWNQEHENAF